MCAERSDEVRKVRVLINPHSGLVSSFRSVGEVLEHHWGKPGIDVTYQFSRDPADGKEKALRAIEDGVDTMLVVGGDGMVNSIGSVLINQDIALGVIPAGSGNGFARHFEIPLHPERAALALVEGDRQSIDVGTANERPFFITCSMAWDGALVRTFEKSPVRGVFPYVFAAVYEYIGYVPQPFHVVLDGEETVRYGDPVIFTVANLTQYGGGARIAPRACPDDGLLELIVMLEKDMPRLVTQLPRLFDGTLDEIPEVECRRFRSLVVRRLKAGPIQLDGELVQSEAEIKIDILPKALTVLVPRKPTLKERVMKTLHISK